MILRFLLFIIIIAFLIAIIVYWLYPVIKGAWYAYKDRVESKDREVEREHQRRNL